MGSATSAASLPCCCSTSPAAGMYSLSATVRRSNGTDAVTTTNPEGSAELALGEHNSPEQTQDVSVHTAGARYFISLAASPHLNVDVRDCDEQGITPAEANVHEVQIRMPRFEPLTHHSQQQQVGCSREDQLDCSKSRSSQLRVSFTVAVRFDDDDTQVSDDDSCESTARSLSTMLLSSGPLSPQTAPAGAAAVGAEPTAFGAAAVVVPLIRDDVKHRHQQAVPRAARSRNNRIREITARHRPSPFPERPESRPPGINCNMAQNSLAVSNLLPDNSFL